MEEGTERMQEPECYEMLPAGHDIAIALMNAQQLSVPGQDHSSKISQCPSRQHLLGSIGYKKKEGKAEELV